LDAGLAYGVQVVAVVVVTCRGGGLEVDDHLGPDRNEAAITNVTDEDRVGDSSRVGDRSRVGDSEEMGATSNIGATARYSRTSRHVGDRGQERTPLAVLAIDRVALAIGIGVVVEIHKHQMSMLLSQ